MVKHRKNRQHFTNVGPNLADKIAPVSKLFQDFINSVPSDWLSSFTHVTAKELKTITKGFKDGKAPGADIINYFYYQKSTRPYFRPAAINY